MNWGTDKSRGEVLRELVGDYPFFFYGNIITDGECPDPDIRQLDAEFGDGERWRVNFGTRPARRVPEGTGPFQWSWGFFDNPNGGMSYCFCFKNERDAIKARLLI